jgi:hypothetical protein
MKLIPNNQLRTLNLKHQHSTLCPKPGTLSPKPETLIPKSGQTDATAVAGSAEQWLVGCDGRPSNLTPPSIRTNSQPPGSPPSPVWADSQPPHSPPHETTESPARMPWISTPGSTEKASAAPEVGNGDGHRGDSTRSSYGQTRCGRGGGGEYEYGHRGDGSGYGQLVSSDGIHSSRVDYEAEGHGGEGGDYPWSSYNSPHASPMGKRSQSVSQMSRGSITSSSHARSSRGHLSGLRWGISSFSYEQTVSPASRARQVFDLTRVVLTGA